MESLATNKISPNFWTTSPKWVFSIQVLEYTAEFVYLQEHGLSCEGVKFNLNIMKVKCYDISLIDVDFG